ncbi:hypothetical protein M9458_042301, partial [Cirrhinus mrigala]
YRKTLPEQFPKSSGAMAEESSDATDKGTLRVLASYRTLLILLLLYMLFALLSFGVLSSTGLILIVSFLYELL